MGAQTYWVRWPHQQRPQIVVVTDSGAVGSQQRTVRLTDGTFLDAVRLPDGGYSVRWPDGTMTRFDILQTRNDLMVTIDGRVHSTEVLHERDAALLLATKKAGHGGKLTVSMPGRVVKILVAENSPVEPGQPVLIIEAMKMENEVRSPGAGYVRKLHVREGDTVESGAVLAEIASAEEV